MYTVSQPWEEESPDCEAWANPQSPAQLSEWRESNPSNCSEAAFKLASFSPHFNLLPYGVLGFSSIQVSLFEGYTNQPTWTHPGKAVQILQLCLRGKMHICVDEGVVLGRCLERTSASSCDPVFPDINSIPGPCLLWPVRTTCAQLDVSLGSWT